MPGPFNFSRLNNAAARAAEGDYLLFLNNDVEVIAPGWLEALLEQAQRPDVGAVGARLLFPEGFVQHAGVVLGLGGIAGHAGRLLPPDGGGYHRCFDVVRECSAVTAACLMMRRALFLEVGGLDEQHLPVGFNDVDLCLRLQQCGLSVVYTPHAELLHYESLSRGPRVDDAEVRTMRERWGAALAADPYYSASLSLEREDFEVRP
jgi:GT2 family glycosyltransferase